MNADTITIPALSALIVTLREAASEIVEIKIKADLGLVTTETAAELIKEIRDNVNLAFDGQLISCAGLTGGDQCPSPSDSENIETSAGEPIPST